MLERLDLGNAVCPLCAGTGRDPKKRKRACPRCSGDGKVSCCTTCGELMPCSGTLPDTYDQTYCARRWVLETAAECCGVRLDPESPFGIAEAEQPSVPTVHSDNCYICNDPDYARYGLPLCRPCILCGGHVAADDVRCDGCGADQEVVHMLINSNVSVEKIQKACVFGVYVDTAYETRFCAADTRAAVARILTEQAKNVSDKL